MHAKLLSLLALGFLWGGVQFGLAQVGNLVLPGLRVPGGFRVSVYADTDLAGEITAMTLNARGEALVAGPGSIQLLQDHNQDGRADEGVVFATTEDAVVGLCWEEERLFALGEGWFSRYEDRDDDGTADGPPYRLLPLDSGARGAHAARRGPDGRWYIISGPDYGLTNQPANLVDASKSLEGGVLLKLTPDGRRAERVAYGFRNPQGLDFNMFGELFTGEADEERDLYLPWYAPARFYDIAGGGHHGWRRPEYYADAAAALVNIGRASPASIVCYRHYQFPLHYRNGLFAADRLTGRILYLPLQPEGASYQTQMEVFLDPQGMPGFVPVDLAITPDGSLLVAVGGNQTPGGIYRIEYTGAGDPRAAENNWRLDTIIELDTVLLAPQPLEAWSRALWRPVAERLGQGPFEAVAMDNRVAPGLRVRAVEVLVELFDGLSPNTALAVSRANAPAVRARAAWALACAPQDNTPELLLSLARDTDPAVRRAALEAALSLGGAVDAEIAQQMAAANAGGTDKRLRQGAAQLASRLPEGPWRAFASEAAGGSVQSALTAALALVWRAPLNGVQRPVLEATLVALARAQTTDQRLQAMRCLMLGLGDADYSPETPEVYARYQPAYKLPPADELSGRMRKAVRIWLIPGTTPFDLEAARLLAMLRDDAPETPGKMLVTLNERSQPGADLHALIVLARLGAVPDANTRGRIANAILGLDRKLDLLRVRDKERWFTALAVVAGDLVRRDPGLADTLLRHREFVRPAHLALVPALGPERKLAAARLFAVVVQNNPHFAWSAPLFELLEVLPPETSFPLFRRQWTNALLRDELLTRLARKPMIADRDKFLVGLHTARLEVVEPCLEALEQLPVDETKKSLFPLMRLLQRLLRDPGQQALRSRTISLLNRDTGLNFQIQEPSSDPDSLDRAYRPVFEWFRSQYPALARQLSG